MPTITISPRAVLLAALLALGALATGSTVNTDFHVILVC